MANSPSQSETHVVNPASEAESQLSSIVYDMSQQVQMAMSEMLKTITTEIDVNSAGIMEDLDKCKDSALERRKVMEEEKEQFQKAAFAVLNMLNNRD